MTVDSKGRELFIVDNSVSGWTGLRYLEEWSSIAKAFDIATGFFEIGALLALDGKWQDLDKIRILMGAETTHRTRKAILEAVRAQALDRLDESIEEDKEPNPFLHGVPAILDALRSGQIECRVYDKDKFHAKAYITHAKLEVVGAQALVGSSNFTRPGLTKNIELNVQIQSAREVAQLQEWFETHWNEASEVTEAVIETISHHTHLYSPFDVYAKALQQFFREHELTATEWDETRSRMFPHLDRYQKEAYWALMKIARQHGGAFLCDGVGLGKTFVGLMLIERLILHEGKRVALFAPKAAKEAVWEPHLRRWLPHIGGIGGGADFSNLAVFSHTDLGREGDFPERFRRIAELADVAVIDEAHHFRNPGRRGNPERGIEPSRYHRLFELLDNAERPKTVYMLTATPINNRLSDFRHMTELFTRRDEAYFARTIGVNNLRTHFNQMESTLRSRVGQDVADAAEHMTESQEILFTDEIFRQLVVQRSRAYARESQTREYGNATAFPERKDPRVAAYSVRKTYGRMLDLLEKAFAKQSPLFTLPMYYPLHWYRGPDKDIDPFEENRQRQVVGLIRTNFLNDLSSPQLAEQGREEIRVLISTDVLSEGLNLQDASRMINYDIHWNPVRLMQRIGRVDRRMDPEIEKRLVADHPEVATSRGKVWFWNFLPPEELNEILSLYAKVIQKAFLISETLGIEGRKLLTPEDDYEALREFNHAYEGTRTAVEDMHLEYQALLQADSALAARLARLPGAIFSGRKRLPKGLRGVFFCYALPALDKEKNEFTEEAGTTRWYLYDLDRRTILEEPGEIVASIRSKPETPRRCTTEETTLLDIRKRIEKHIKNSCLKRVDAPVGVKPRLRCWMELNEG